MQYEPGLGLSIRLGGDMKGPALEALLIEVCGAGCLDESPNKRRREAASAKHTQIDHSEEN